MPEDNKLPQEEPFYNIGVVSRVTGVPIATLHAWERRYDFPHSARSPGGHRLYSEKDISRLRWVKLQVEAGMQTRQAIQAAQRLDSQGYFAVTQTLELTAPATASPSQAPLVGREQLLKALLDHNLEEADRMMGEMLAFHTPEDLTLNIIGPTLEDIGREWETGRIDVADEHLASSYLRHRLLMWMVTGPRSHPVAPTVLACAPGEWHEGSLLMLGVLLRRQGWPVAYLGQNVPLKDLATFSQGVHPLAIVLVAMTGETGRALIDWPKHVAQAAGQPMICFGGQGFLEKPELQTLVPGTYLGNSLQEGVEKLLNLLPRRA